MVTVCFPCKQEQYFVLVLQSSKESKSQKPFPNIKLYEGLRLARNQQNSSMAIEEKNAGSEMQFRTTLVKLFACGRLTFKVMSTSSLFATSTHVRCHWKKTGVSENKTKTRKVHYHDYHVIIIGIVQALTTGGWVECMRTQPDSSAWIT